MEDKIYRITITALNPEMVKVNEIMNECGFQGTYVIQEFVYRIQTPTEWNQAKLDKDVISKMIRTGWKVLNSKIELLTQV